MRKKIRITEKQEQILLEHLIMEKTYPVDTNKVRVVNDYLDKHFERVAIDEIGADGMPVQTKAVGLLSGGKTVKYLNARQLFDLLEDEFRGMFSDKIQRAKFLVQVIKDWYKKEISKEGLLSTTHC